MSALAVDRHQDSANGRGSPAGGELSRSREEATMAILVSTVRWDMALNYAARVGVGILGFVSAGLAVRYTWVHGGEMVDVLVKTSADQKLLERLVALTTPVVILMVIAALAVAVIWALHARGLEETARAVDSMNRIRRESEVAVSARGLIHAFEEKLANASRGFSVLLWLGRTLFIVCLGLFATAVIAATADGVNVFTVAMGATSIVGVLLAVLTGLPEKTQHQLADVVQIQSIITGCDRQISLLETEAVTVLNRVGPDCANAPTSQDWEHVHRTLTDVRRQMDEVVAHAVDLIDKYADPLSKAEPAAPDAEQTRASTAGDGRAGE